MVAQYDQQCICIVGHIVPPFYSGGASVFCFSVGLKCEEGMGRRSWGGWGWVEGGGEGEGYTKMCNNYKTNIGDFYFSLYVSK